MGLIETPATIGEIIATVPTTVISAFMISGISLIPLFLNEKEIDTDNDYFGSNNWYAD